MASFTLRQLEYVSAVARDGGIAQAARSLNVSQPSVAQGLDKLEALTGLVLFDRHHARGVTLTPQGRQFLDHARALLDHARQVERDAAAIAAYEAGELRLGCFTTIAAFYLPGLVRSFSKQYPNAKLIAQEATMDVLAAKVRDGHLDVCLTYDVENTLEGLNMFPLAVVRPTVLLPSQHLKAGKKSIRLSELLDEPYVLYDAPGSREYYASLLGDAGLSPKIAYASQTLEGVRSAVGAGFGFSIVAQFPRNDETYEGNQISAVRLADEEYSLPIVVAARHSGETNRILTQFIEHAQSCFVGLA